MPGMTSSVRKPPHGVEHLACGRPPVQPGVSGSGVGRRRRTGRLPLVGCEQLDQVPLLLGDAPADRRQLVRADRTREVRPRLTHAADAPLQRLLHQPPVEARRGRPAARPRLRTRRRAGRSCRRRRPRAARRTATPSRTATRGPRADRRRARAPSRSTAARPRSSTMTLPMPQVAVDDRRRGARRPVGARASRTPSRTSGSVRRPPRTRPSTARASSTSAAPGTSAGSMACSPARNRPELVDEVLARARRTRRRAGSCGRASRPARALITRAGRAEQRAVVVDEHLGHARGRPCGTRASRRPPAASTAARPGRPGGSRRKIERAAVRRERPRLAGRAAGQPLQARRSSTGPEDRFERGLRAAQIPTLVPTGTSSTTWSRYSERPAPVEVAVAPASSCPR